MTEQEITLLQMQLANAKDALYFAKLDHERELETFREKAKRDAEHIDDLMVIIRDAKGWQ